MKNFRFSYQYSVYRHTKRKLLYKDLNILQMMYKFDKKEALSLNSASFPCVYYFYETWISFSKPNNELTDSSSWILEIA